MAHFHWYLIPTQHSAAQHQNMWVSNPPNFDLYQFHSSRSHTACALHTRTHKRHNCLFYMFPFTRFHWTVSERLSPLGPHPANPVCPGGKQWRTNIPGELIEFLAVSSTWHYERTMADMSEGPGAMPLQHVFTYIGCMALYGSSGTKSYPYPPPPPPPWTPSESSLLEYCQACERISKLL